MADKYNKALPNPYNPSDKTSKLRTSKKQHVTPVPENRIFDTPKGHEAYLGDSDRAHSGAPGMKVRHGQDATGKVTWQKLNFGRDID